MSTTPTPLDPPGPATAHLEALRAERHRIERVLAELAGNGLDQHTEEEDLGEIASASQHPADVASETLEREVELGLLDEFRDALAEIDAAEHRMAAGTYGTCERCGQAIGDLRLAAVPATRWCLACAEAVEHDQRWRTPGSRRRDGALASAEFLAGDDEREPPEDRQLSGEEAALRVRDLLGGERSG